MIRAAADRGKVTIFVAIVAPAWIAILGMVIIGGGRVRAHQRADNVAAEAARTAGQAIDPDQAILGRRKRIDPVLANKAAQSYLTAAGATGTVVVEPQGRWVTVTAVVTYTNPSGLDFLGGSTWSATGEATATLIVR